MKKAIIVLLTATVLFSFTSCTGYQNNELTEREIEIANRVIVRSVGIAGGDLGRAVADINNIEAITELSTQIVLARVDRLERAYMTELNVPNFIYEITIKDIYMDVNNRLTIGDSVRLSTARGLMQGNEFTRLVGNSAHAQKFGYANQEYRDNEYVASSAFQGIPIEVGRTYIIYLTDMFLRSDGLYADIGKQFIYEYTEGVIFQGLEYQRMDMTLAQLTEQISIDISNRTGRADELGFDNFVRELGEIQRQAQANYTQ